MRSLGEFGVLNSVPGSECRGVRSRKSPRWGPGPGRRGEAPWQSSKRNSLPRPGESRGLLRGRECPGSLRLLGTHQGPWPRKDTDSAPPHHRNPARWQKLWAIDSFGAVSEFPGFGVGRSRAAAGGHEGARPPVRLPSGGINSASGTLFPRPLSAACPTRNSMAAPGAHPNRRPLWALVLLSPVIAEMLSGSTPPIEWLNPVAALFLN